MLFIVHTHLLLVQVYSSKVPPTLDVTNPCGIPEVDLEMDTGFYIEVFTVQGLEQNS